MEVFLISNNLYENELVYQDSSNIDVKKITRPLSIAGEKEALNIALNEELKGVTSIYSSPFASALGSAKYLAGRYNKKVHVNDLLKDCLIGNLGNKNLSRIKFMQNHDFDIKLDGGESLHEVGKRINTVVEKIIYLNNANKVAVYTHRRAILGYLIKYANVGYNLDDEIVLEFGDKVVYNEIEKDVIIIKLTIEDGKIIDIDALD